MDSSIPTLMRNNNVRGISVVVIRNGEISISKSFGYADVELKKKVNAHTVFRAASLGKPILAYIAVLLARQGTIDLDLPMYSYLEKEVAQGDPRSRIITARMVLTHTTGLPNLDGLHSDMEFLFDPGTDFEYSGHAYLFLQRVIEKVTGRHLQELASVLVFQPLKMTQSSFIWQDKYSETISSSYNGSGGVFPSEAKPVKGYSAWSLFTTAGDYGRFVTHTMKTSNIPGSVAETMLKPYVDVATDVKWGLGWGLQDTVPNHSFWHWVSIAGFRHYVVGYPVERTGVIVMTNSQNAFTIVDDIMADAIGGSYPSYDWF